MRASKTRFKANTAHHDRIMDRLLQLLGRFVQFSYACWDRIVLRGCYPRLQRPANTVHLFRDVGGEARITPAVLAADGELPRAAGKLCGAARDSPPDGAEGHPQGGIRRALLPCVQGREGRGRHPQEFVHPAVPDPRIHETGLPYGADAGTEVGFYEWCRELVQGQ